MNPLPSERSSSDVKFEIGHVSFIDIVGYSKLLIHEQANIWKDCVRSSVELSHSASLKRKAG